MVQLGYSEAWSYLGYAYEDTGLYDKALECYKKGAALGDKKGSSISASVLGMIYLEDCTDESIIKSIEWFKAAADMGETDAMIFLAIKIYLSNDEKMRDYHNEEQGIRLLEKAASCGN